MKSINSYVKVLSLVLAVILLGSFATISLAADSSVTTKDLNGAYGNIVPTDANLKAQKKSYSFSGDSTTLYFWMISKGKSNANCAVEIYSDSKHSDNKLVTSYTNTLGNKGERALSVSWNFKSLHSGTYYGKSYIYKTSGEKKTIDSDTVNYFTVKIDRISKKTVTLSSISNGKGYVTLNWKTLKTATKYIIYRKLSTEKSFSKLATVKAGVSSYKDTEVKSGKTYVYTVKAYDGGFTSKNDKTGLKILYLSRPELNKISSTTTKGYAKLSWKKVTGAKGYYIYRKGGTLSNSKWEKIADVNASTLSYVDKKATSTDWKYTYTVKAYNGSYKSTCNGTGVEYTHLAAPKLTSLSISSTGLTLKWKESNSSTVKYYIYRKTTADGSWSKIGTSTSKSYTDKTVKSGKTYYYTVKAICSTNASAYNGTGLNKLFLAVPELATVTTDEKGNMTVKWKSVDGAKGYVVYKRIKGGDWAELKTVENAKTLSYTDKATKKAGTVYQYTVKAYNGKVYSKYDSTGLSGMYLAAPTTKLENVEGGIKISWNTVTGAKSYNVYKKAEGKTSWTCICKGCTDKSYIDDNITYNKKYTYMVKAVSDSFNSSYKSAEIYAVSTPVLTGAVKTTDGISISWEPVDGADTYYVYRKVSGGKWALIGSYSQNEYVDTDATALTEKYYYTVKAARDNSEGCYDKNGVSAFVDVSNVSATFGYTGEESNIPSINVTWDACKGDVSAYEIYRSADGEKAVLVKTTETAEELAYTDTDILQGVNYVYSVKPVNENKVAFETSSESAKWPWPPVEAVELSCEAVEETNETSYGICVKWTSVEFADSYDVMRKTEESEWEVLANITDSLEYFDDTIEKDVTYYYTVKGVASDRDSLYNETGVKAILYSPLEGTTPSVELIDDENVDGKKNVLVKWENDENVEKYDLFRKAGDGDWEILTFDLVPPAQNQYIDKDIEQGVTYTYKVEVSARNRSTNQHEESEPIIWELPPETVE